MKAFDLPISRAISCVYVYTGTTRRFTPEDTRQPLTEHCCMLLRVVTESRVFRRLDVRNEVKQS